MTILFDNAIQALMENKKHLQDEMTMHDRAIIDLQHLIEGIGDNIPSDDMVQIFKRFANVLHRRRECKNRLQTIQSIEDRMNKQAFYSPRVLHDEFIRYKEYLCVTIPTYEVQNTVIEREVQYA
jgi:hypothetical protein